MPSGAIFGTCHLCKEHVWEDQHLDFDDKDRIYHKPCYRKALKQNERSATMRKLQRENKQLAARIAELESEKSSGQTTLF